MSSYLAPTASGPLDADLRVPGSKSLTARELVLSALADGPSRLRRPLHARDTRLMVEALRTLGARIEEVPGDGDFGPDLIVHPATGGTDAAIDCGLAGTVMRFLVPVAALHAGRVAFDGDAAARVRPMAPILEAVRALGVDVHDDGRGTLPFTIAGSSTVRGGELDIDASGSSQFVSALLLAAPRFTNGLTLRHTGGRLPSVPHIEMTLDTLRARGVNATSPEAGVWVVERGPIAAREVTIEPDLSNAAPFLAAALVAGGRVSVHGWPASTTQVGDEVLPLLAMFGARVEQSGDTVTVHGGVGVRGGDPLPPVDLDLTRGGELAPTLAGLAALSNGESRITGIGHLRGHETDRLAALAHDLTALGSEVRVDDDGLTIFPRILHGGDWQCFGDHRMATTGALLGLAVPGVALDDVRTTHKTLPEFVDLWERMVGVS